jgi:aspartyl aminopeptidase
MQLTNETGRLAQGSPVLENVLRRNTTELSTPLHSLQASSLARRYAISAEMAAVIAPLVFGGAHDRR